MNASPAPIARAVGAPIRSAEDAAALVGEAVPDSPQRSARVLAELAAFLADKAGRGPAELADLAAEQLLPPFDFGERSFGREDILALPDAPGVHVVWLACERAGLVVVGIGSRSGPAEVRHLLGRTGAVALLAPARFGAHDVVALVDGWRAEGLPLRHHWCVEDDLEPLVAELEAHEVGGPREEAALPVAHAGEGVARPRVSRAHEHRGRAPVAEDGGGDHVRGGAVPALEGEAGELDRQQEDGPVRVGGEVVGGHPAVGTFLVEEFDRRKTRCGSDAEGTLLPEKVDLLRAQLQRAAALRLTGGGEEQGCGKSRRDGRAEEHQK